MGLNTSGIDIDERTASARSPSRSTTPRRAFMSLATQRKGTIRSSKRPPAAAVAGAKSSIRAISTGVEESRFEGSTKRLPGFVWRKSSRSRKNDGTRPVWR